MTALRNWITSTAFGGLLLLFRIQLSTVKAVPSDYLNNYDSNGYDGQPFINPNVPDVTYPVGTNITLRCRSKVEPVVWRLPDTKFGHHEVFSSQSIDESYVYESVLELIDVTYLYVGAYYCMGNSSANERDVKQLQASFKATEIYVFVEDPENPITHNEMPLITAHQYEEIIIPCKPSSRSVSVKLLKADDDPHQQLEYDFDPKIGFTMRINDLFDGGTYNCTSANGKSHELFEVQIKQFTHIANMGGRISRRQLFSTVEPATVYTMRNRKPFRKPNPEYVNKPIITAKGDGHATQGEQLILDCTVDIEMGIRFEMKWILPSNNIALTEGRAIKSNTIYEEPDPFMSYGKGRSRLTVKQLNRAVDQGIYSCEVEDHSKNYNRGDKNITIHDENDSHLEIFEQSGRYIVTVSAKTKFAQWRINYSSYPAIELEWFDNRNRTITPSNATFGKEVKYEIQTDDKITLLKIWNIELKDSGDYTLKANNGLQSKELKVKLIVKDKPSVNVDSVYVMENQTAYFECECAGYPESKITWTFVPCSIWFNQTDCDNRNVADMQGAIIKTQPTTVLAQRSTMSFVATSTGRVSCHASNTEGSDISNAYLLIGDINETLSVWKSTENKVAVGDAVSLYCAALVYNFTGELMWFKDKEMIIENDEIEVIDSTTKYSYHKELKWKSISLEDSGTYECKTGDIIKDITNSKDIYVEVNEPFKPELSTTNLFDDTINKNLGEPHRFHCYLTGIPAPVIKWYKDGHLIDLDEINSENETRITVENQNQDLIISYIKIMDEGLYKCEGSNRLGIASASQTIQIEDKPGITLFQGSLILGVIMLLLAIAICLAIKMCRERKLLRTMKAAGLANFEEGNPECINPALSMDEQADLLPYDKKFEFPRDKLKLGQQLGSGAFGVVVKAIAQEILPYEKETTVAVKMVKQNAVSDNEVMRALISELKIMVHLGQHLNVVNLLGAVTKNIAKREVLVIVEYCQFGNVQQFLLNHRDSFIDQINPETDEIDPTVTTKEQRWSNDSGYEYNSKGESNRMSNRMSNPNTNSGRSRDNHVNSKGYMRHSGMEYFAGGMNSCNTEATLISNTGGDDSVIMSNNSVQPAWRSNYKMDYKGPVRTITTSDLICWAFQVARGMDYLASRKVLHGDLAARNILLTEDNVVKICDFGLARSMYKNDNYKKRGEAPLPFKWLALESISDQVFSTYSDVWSFGIVLWEFFSLAKLPYPGMNADQALYFKLKDGYRMDKPAYANQEIYDLMLHCWNTTPERRPLFGELEKRLAKMLQDGVQEHYIDLNDPYLQMNTQYFSDGQKDYLAMLGPPEDSAPEVPEFAAGMLPPIMEVSSPDYLCMSPKSGNVMFHPQSLDPVLANNHESNYSPKVRRKTGLPEEVPMLKQGQNNSFGSDSEPETSPDANSRTKKFPDTYKTTFDGDERTYKNIQPDNYVNVPSVILSGSAKKNVAKDSFSNPGYITLGIEPSK